MNYYQKRQAQRRREVARKEAIRNFVVVCLVFAVFIGVDTLIYHIQYGW